MEWNRLDNLDVGFDPYDYTVTEQLFGYDSPSSSQSPSANGFQTFMGTFNNLMGNQGGLGFNANNPLVSAQQAGNLLANNLGRSASTAAMAAQGLGIKGQMLGFGASLFGEEMQLGREMRAAQHAQGLNLTTPKREDNAQRLMAGLAGRMNPQAIARTSAMIYGV